MREEPRRRAPAAGSLVTATTGVARYPALDGIRAVAAVAVVATHAAYWTGHYAPDTRGLFLARLDFGVALFFVLSGFLLFRPWVRALRAGRPAPGLRRYLRNRALRILPAYWVVVLVVFVLVPSVNGTGPAGLVRSLTLTQIYGDHWQRTGLTQLWSLATEVAFYLLLPALARLVVVRAAGRGWRPLRMVLACVAIGGISLLWYVLTRTVVTFDISSVFWLPGYLDWFAGGMALSVVAFWWETDRDRSPRVLRTVADAPGSCWVLAGCLIAVASTPVAGAATLVPIPMGEAITKNLLYLVAALAIVAPCVLRPDGTRTTRWLGSPVMSWLGRISYEIFLVHIAVLEGVMRLMDYDDFTGSTGKVLVLTLAFSVPLAWLLFRAVEEPTRRFRARAAVEVPAPPPARP